MKRSIKTLIMLGMIVVLLGGYFIIQQVNLKKTAKEETGSFLLSNKEVSGMEWTIDGETMHFVQEDDVWVDADNASFPTDQTAVQKLADKLTALESTRKISSVSSPEDYGITDESFTVHADWKDGTSTVYTLGAETPLVDGWYLTLSSESDTVYMVESSIASIFSPVHVSLAVLEEIPAPENVTRIQVGDTFNAVYVDPSENLSPDPYWAEYDTGRVLNGTTVKNLVSDAKGFQWSALVSADATEEEIAEYQLDDANAVPVILYDGDSVVLELYTGAANADGDYYARFPDSHMVYTVASDDLLDLLDADVSGMYDKSFIPVKSENLGNVKFTIDTSVWDFNRTVEIQEVESEEPASDEESASEEESSAETAETTVETIEVTVITLNGAEYDESSFETLWKTVSKLSLAGYASEEITDEKLLEISIETADGKAAVIDFYPYSADQYLVSINTSETALISAGDIDTLIRTIKQIK